MLSIMNNPEPGPLVEAPSNPSTIRIEVSLKDTPIVSYAELLKHATEKALTKPAQSEDASRPATDLGLDSYEFGNDPFFDRILANAARYGEEEDGEELDEGEAKPEDEKETETEEIPKKRRRRRFEVEDYDVNDPFIDDSELFISGLGLTKPKQDGFFVYKGPLEMQSIYDDINSSDAFESSGPRKKSKKAKSGAKTNTSDTESARKENQPKEKANPKKQPNEADPKKRPWLDDDSSLDSFADTPTKSGISKKHSDHQKAKQSGEYKSSREDRPKSKKDEKSSKHHKYSHDKKKKKPGSLPPLPSSIETLMTELREATAKESFENKAKFPPALRPVLTRIANAYMLATGAKSPDDDLVLHLTSILPYNKFTLKKLSTKIMLQERLRVQETQFEELFDDFGEKVKAQMKQMMDQHEETRKRLADGEVIGEPNTEPSESTVKREPEEALTPNSKLDLSTNSTAEDGSLLSSEDKMKKFRWNEDLRHGLYQVVKCEMEITNLKNELLELEGHSVKPLSETNQRRAVYQKILMFFEPGWTTSYEISREYSLYKRRVDKRLSKEATREESQGQKKATTTESRSHDSKRPASPMKKKSGAGKYDPRSKVYKILSEMGPSFLSDTDSSDEDLVPPVAKKSSHNRSYTHTHTHTQKHATTTSTPGAVDYDDITTSEDDDLSASNTDSSISSSSISSGTRRRSQGTKKKKLTATESLYNYKKSKEEKAVDSMIAKRKRQKKREQLEKLEQQKQLGSKYGHKGKDHSRSRESKDTTTTSSSTPKPESGLGSGPGLAQGQGQGHGHGSRSGNEPNEALRASSRTASPSPVVGKPPHHTVLVGDGPAKSDRVKYIHTSVDGQFVIFPILYFSVLKLNISPQLDHPPPFIANDNSSRNPWATSPLFIITSMFLKNIPKFLSR
ncbi:hypothetical protein K493DRAFT_32219 [Basidiobolus meristosporus CBS 931.73]|uniref:Ubinuclein middle domain-containing protein n=1 Tax=Basidiobolus meristosporus CBS 931.73 TaxID=1314790 RepID=A0A1Y1Y869_9FUNG|nr:hypothetical protein K493DRAFT_32219 [Basidiobolus meristosporus CBS 931.73]|eukprot:ORX94159.1 hypothetical protein K493DRAFT_32219 [Basidiobolus meristosporus CBS 931.73]